MMNSHFKYFHRNPTVSKNCSSDPVKLLKFDAEGQEFAKILRLLEQFIQTVKGHLDLDHD